MLLPIGDDNTGRGSTPFVVYTLIAINAIVFLVFQQTINTKAGFEFTYAYSVVPREITHNEDLVGAVRMWRRQQRRRGRYPDNLRNCNRPGYFGVEGRTIWR